MPDAPVNVGRWAPDGPMLTAREQKLIAYLRSPLGTTLRRIMLIVGNLPQKKQRGILAAAEIIEMETRIDGAKIIQS